MQRERKVSGTIALITTPQFRIERKKELEAFCYSHLYFLCSNFDVVSTGNTFSELQGFVKRSFGELTNDNKDQICTDWNLVNKNKLKIKAASHLTEWRERILEGLQGQDPKRPAEGSVKGMIDIISRLVNGEIDAVIHLTDWQDKSAKQDSAVLSREANVHDIPIATNVESAEVFIEQWLDELRQSGRILFEKADGCCNTAGRISLKDVYDAFHKNNKTKVLAMISHNGKKTDMDIFTVEHKDQILKSDYILATESTGERILRIMKALDGKDYSKRICCCKPGPKGGDLQIAHAVIKGICGNIIFFQDPQESQPHDADIRLFEQAVTTRGVNARLATNPASAKLLINWLAK